MAFTIAISEAAEWDVQQAFQWYEEQQESLGATFETHFSKAIDSIRTNPLKTQVRYHNVRVLFLKKFPFGIHYIIKGNTVIVIAVFHTAMDPTRWGKRNDDD